MNKFFKITIFIVIFLSENSFLNLSFNAKSEENNYSKIEKKNFEPPFLEYINSTWVDSVFNSLTPDDRIAQLFIIAAYSNRWNAHKNEITNLIKKYKIGGLLFFQGGPVRQANLTNYFQKISKTPLLIAMDAEWGLAMRLDSTMKFPRQMQLGAIKDDELIYKMGEEIAKQCKRIGVHINFAPVIDVNNNPKNPVINSRSFGENKFNVAQKGHQYMMGLQDNNILAVGKHFPGHGDTDSDSHKTLPIIKHSRERLDSLEIYPFKTLIEKGLGGIMVAHLHIPALDDRKNIASSLSKKIVTDLLKKELNFKGLTFTDALNMNGVKKHNIVGKVDAKALLAGNDILLMSENVEKAIKEIKISIAKGEITQKKIDEKCKKILALKHWVGLDNFKKIQTKNLYEDLNNNSAKLLKRKLIEASFSLLKNKNNILPIKNLNKFKIASVSIGTDEEQNEFQKQMQSYMNVPSFNLFNASATTFNLLIDTLKKFDILLVSIHGNDRKNFDISSPSVDFIQKLSIKTKVILNIFSNPYSLKDFKNLENLSALIIAYQDEKLNQNLLAQSLFGGIKITGDLPISINENYKCGKYLETNEKFRLKYSIPEEVGIKTKMLSKIDSIVFDGIEKKAFPGCQIFFAKKGVVFYKKSFGFHTYKKERKVENTDLYDLASLTKVAATTVSLMKLYDEKKFDFNKKLKNYLPELDTTNKKKMKIRNILTHQSGLLPGIMFYHSTVNKVFEKKRKKKKRRRYSFVLNDNFYKKKFSEDFSIPVAKNIFLKTNHKENMYIEILNSKLRRKKYRYSDLSFFFMQRLVEKLSKTSLDNYTENNFYSILGAKRLTFNPLEKFSIDEIVPTAQDNNFRKQLIHGYVHDEGSAMMGGVAGHAGLFSNAEDLGKLMQMLLQNGSYGGTKFLKKETIKTFTKYQHFVRRNRRALGFDKPQNFNKKKYSPVCRGISDKSFGHTGFTGTICWVDPEEEIVYVFLSNRIYKDPNNKKLLKMGIRKKIQKVVYDNFKKK